MKKKQPTPTQPLPLIQAACCLRVSGRWLREEIEAGRLPGLRTGRTIPVHVPTVVGLNDTAWSHVLKTGKSRNSQNIDNGFIPKRKGSQK